MKFWDSSAAVPLIIDERDTADLQKLLSRDPAMIVWWATSVECASAIARREREHMMSAEVAREARASLQRLAAFWSTVDPGPDLRDAALRLLRVHDLRASDALQLAAAYLASERRPATLEFVCRDDRLARAAEREGFPLR